jgi:hypothetical protein
MFTDIQVKYLEKKKEDIVAINRSEFLGLPGIKSNLHRSQGSLLVGMFYLLFSI